MTLNASQQTNEWAYASSHTLIAHQSTNKRRRIIFRFFIDSCWQMTHLKEITGKNGKNTAIADTKSYHIVTNCHTDFYVGGPLVWQSALTHSNTTQRNSTVPHRLSHDKTYSSSLFIWHTSHTRPGFSRFFSRLFHKMTI